MSKYGPRARKIIQETMEEYSKGELKSGSTNNVVKNRKQAVAIGISEARKKGFRVLEER